MTLSFLGCFLIFLRLKAITTDAIPEKTNDNAVSITNDNPEKIGLAINKNDNKIPNTLAIATFPQFKTPELFISNAKPNDKTEKNRKTNYIR